MEDAATAEISRAQVWQWICHGAKLADGRTVDAALCRAMLDEELQKLRAAAGDGGRYEDAARRFRDLSEASRFVEFLPIPPRRLKANPPRRRKSGGQRGFDAAKKPRFSLISRGPVRRLSTENVSRTYWRGIGSREGVAEWPSLCSKNIASSGVAVRGWPAMPRD
jgi:hypothetical protein